MGTRVMMEEEEGNRVCRITVVFEHQHQYVAYKAVTLVYKVPTGKHKTGRTSRPERPQRRRLAKYVNTRK